MNSADRFIKKTYFPTDGSSITMNELHHGIVIDNRDSSPMSFTIDEVERTVPATSVRGFELTTPFNTFEVSGLNYEVHIFN